MRTLKFTKWFLYLAIITSSLVSCVKSDLPSASNSNLLDLLGQEKAYISYLGAVNDTTNNLFVILQGVKYELTNNYGTFLQSGSEIRVSFYSNSNSGISPGVYTYADSLKITPFTFNNALLSLGGGFIIINKGTISVNTSSSGYNIIFKCGLSDGESFTANYFGILTPIDLNKN